MGESLDDCLKKVLRKVLADSGSGSFPSAIQVNPNLHSYGRPKLHYLLFKNTGFTPFFPQWAISHKYSNQK